MMEHLNVQAYTVLCRISWFRTYCWCLRGRDFPLHLLGVPLILFAHTSWRISSHETQHWRWTKFDLIGWWIEAMILLKIVLKSWRTIGVWSLIAKIDNEPPHCYGMLCFTQLLLIEVHGCPWIWSCGENAGYERLVASKSHPLLSRRWSYKGSSGAF